MKENNIKSIYNELKKFIKENNIKKRSELKGYNHEYYLFKKLPKEDRFNLLKPFRESNSISNSDRFNELKNFIEINGIKTRDGFYKHFQKQYNIFRKLSEEDKEKLLPLKNKNLKFLNSYKDFKKFILDNNIKSRVDFSFRFRTVYEKFNKLLTSEEKDKLLPKLSLSYDKIITLNDFNKFISENNIKTLREFNERFSSLFKKFCKSFSKEERNKVLPNLLDKKKLDRRTFDYFDNFIKNHNIHSKSELKKKFSGVYKAFLLLPKEDRETLLPSLNKLSKEELSLINSINSVSVTDSKENLILDFKNFVETNSISSRNSLSKRFHTVYRKLILVLTDEEISVVLPKLNKSYGVPTTIEEYSKFIRDNNINSRVELCKKFHVIYEKFKKLSEEEKDLILPKKNQKWEFIKTIEDLQDFIDKNKVTCRNDLGLRFNRLYVKFLKELDKVEFVSKSNKSSMEKLVESLLSSNNIKFESEKTFPNLRDMGYLRYDFFLPKYNIIIECHGAQHFDINSIYYSEDLLKHDKTKYDYAINHNINIIYYTSYKYFYKKYGYFAEVLTDVEALLERIKEIGLTNQSNIN